MKGLGIFYGFVLLMVVVSVVTRPDAEWTAEQRLSDVPSSKAEVRAYVTSQASEGFTQAEFTQDVLNRIEEWLSSTLEQFAKMHAPPGDVPNIETSGVYVDIEGTRLVVVKLSSTGVRGVIVMGIKGDYFVRVNCLRESEHDIPVWSGACGDSINKTFGVSISA